MAKYKQLFLVADTFLPWETVGGRAGNREIEACQLNSWHRNWVKVCRHCLKPNCGRYSKELEYTVSFNVFYERDIWLSGWYGVSFLDKFNFLTFNGGLLMSFLLFERRSLLMYDVNLAPDNIKNMFTKLSSLHSYRTRSVTNENYHMLNKLELKIWREPSLFPVLWFGTVFHFLSKHFKKIDSKAN